MSGLVLQSRLLHLGRYDDLAVSTFGVASEIVLVVFLGYPEIAGRLQLSDDGIFPDKLLRVDG